MHQDSRKSVVYRSFVTCDDPKGVVECGTIRRSKNGLLKMEHKMETRKGKKKSDAREEAVCKGVSKGQELQSPASFQLSEVARGAEKLNQMIDSWSKGKRYDTQSNDVARDLLKGALDLQESLMMLGKLQEVSQYKALLKTKHKEMPKAGRNDGMRIQRASSYHFGDQNCPVEFQKPRLSTDGASRDCFEELREVIRDSLARQNLLPKTYSEELMGFHQQRIDSYSNIPSTSSSHSSITHTSNYSSSASPLSFAAPEKKVKGPGLIAKLMGLEEVPSNPSQSNPQKQIRDNRLTCPQRPSFDIDRPKVKKPHFAPQQESPGRKTLKEILETMHSSGVLKSNSTNELEGQSHQSTSNLHSKERSIGNISPIVLIKPCYDQFVEPEEIFAPVIEEKGVQAKQFPKKLNVKEELSSRKIDCREGTLRPSKTNRKTGEDNSINRLSKEGAKKSKHMIEKHGGKAIKTKLGSSKTDSLGDCLGDIIQQPEKKVTFLSNRSPKVIIGSRKPVEKEIVKSKIVSRSQEKDKVTVTNVRKPTNGSHTSKNQNVRSVISNRTKRTVNKAVNKAAPNDRISSQISTRDKPVVEPTTTSFTIQDVGCKEDEEKMNFASEDDSCPMGENDKCVDQLLTEKEANVYEIQITEYSDKSQTPLSEANLLATEWNRETEFLEGIMDEIKQIRLEMRSFKKGTQFKTFLSSNPAFLSQAEELFDLKLDNHSTIQSCEKNDISYYIERVSLDCANELMERRSLPDSRTSDPLLLTWLRSSRIHLSLDELVEEISDGVETLRSFSKAAGEELHSDRSLNAVVMRRDMECNGIVSGIWDLGWRNQLSADDTEAVGNEIEKLLFADLIDEISTEVLLC